MLGHDIVIDGGEGCVIVEHESADKFSMCVFLLTMLSDTKELTEILDLMDGVSIQFSYESSHDVILIVDVNNGVINKHLIVDNESIIIDTGLPEFVKRDLDSIVIHHGANKDWIGSIKSATISTKCKVGKDYKQIVVSFMRRLGYDITDVEIIDNSIILTEGGYPVHEDDFDIDTWEILHFINDVLQSKEGLLVLSHLNIPSNWIPRFTSLIDNTSFDSILFIKS